ncbi:MAG: ATP-binding protein [archaeon]
MLGKKKKKEIKGDDELRPYLIMPDQIKINSDHAIVHDTMNRVLMAAGYPRKVTEGFLDKIIRSRGNFDISIHIQPYSIDQMITNLNNLLKKLNADKYAAEKRGTFTPSIDLLIKDTRKVLDQLQSGEEKLFNTGLYINVKGKDKEELELLSKRVEAELNSLMIVTKKPVFKMREALQSVMPLGRDKLGFTRPLTTSALSACFPFTSSFLASDGAGIMLATNKQNGVPIIKDFFKFTNPNSLILATSGAGKSYLVKLNLIRSLMAGTRVFVIDPQAEYIELSNAVGGQVIEISKDSKSIINPLDLMGQDFTEKRLSLLSAFAIMFEGLDDIQMSLLDKAVTETYKRKCITKDEPESWKKEPPILEDLHNVLTELAEEATGKEAETLKGLASRMERYVSGVFSFVNKQTKLNLKDDFICFDIGKMPTQIRPLMMYLILEYIYAQMQKDRTRKILAIDEAWSLLHHASSAEYLFKIVKTSRKFNLAFMLITQEVNDLLKQPAGQAVLANTSCKYLLKQDPSVIDELIKTLHLAPEEKNLLLTAGLGEGIMIADNERFPIKIIASQEEDAIITTNADALNAQGK